MNSIVLRTGVQTLKPLMLLFSIYLLLVGHNEPGGGFVGGLVAAIGFSLHAIAFDTQQARRALLIPPLRIMGYGLLIAAGSGMLGPLLGMPFLTGQWTEVVVPGFGLVHLGTPLVFDIGVYFAVLGMAMLIIFELMEQEAH